LQPNPKVYINPKDAVKLKLKEGEQIELHSSSGKIQMSCSLSLEVRQGHLFTTFHFFEAIANTLTNKNDLDPHSKMAGLKVVLVNIKKVIQNE
ncbi:MAG: formate dehydrogenase subunit alpha, partial [Spirochaetes bacterium]|nr:formate dehydrogenase subunit alpha [Spirochaetota bacterium]